MRVETARWYPAGERARGTVNLLAMARRLHLPYWVLLGRWVVFWPVSFTYAGDAGVYDDRRENWRKGGDWRKQKSGEKSPN